MSISAVDTVNCNMDLIACIHSRYAVPNVGLLVLIWELADPKSVLPVDCATCVDAIECKAIVWVVPSDRAPMFFGYFFLLATDYEMTWM